MKINRMVQGLAVTASAAAVSLSMFTGPASAATPEAATTTVTTAEAGVTTMVNCGGGGWGCRPRWRARGGWKHCWGEWKPRRNHRDWWDDDDDDNIRRHRRDRGFKWFYTCAWRR